jgi:hypothetical protein
MQRKQRVEQKARTKKGASNTERKLIANLCLTHSERDVIVLKMNSFSSGTSQAQQTCAKEGKTKPAPQPSCDKGPGD